MALATEATISLETAQRIGAELQYCLESNNNMTNINGLLEQQNANLYNLSESYKEKLMLMEQDKEIFKVRGDKFQDEYKACSTELSECYAERPSRLTWYSYGFLSASILGVIVVVLANN